MANIYQSFFVELNTDDPSSALRFGLNNGNQKPTPVFVLGDTIHFDLRLLENNVISPIVDSANEYTVKVGIGDQNGNYALTEVTYPSASYGWTGSLSLNNVALGNFLSGYSDRDAKLSIGLFKSIETSASFYTVLHTPVTIQNEILSGPYETGSLAGYWTKEEADARFLKNDQNISGAFWVLSGVNICTAQETYSVGIGTNNPTKKLDVRGDAFFQDRVTLGDHLSGSLIGVLAGTASWAISSSRAIIAVSANTASYVLTAKTASYVVSASYASSTFWAETASYAGRATEAYNATYATAAIDSTFAESSSMAMFAVGATSSSYADRALDLIKSNYPITVTYATTSLSSSYTNYAVTASYAINASLLSSVSASFASSSVSASYATNALSASYSAFIYYNVTQSLTSISSASWASSSFLATRATYATSSGQSVSSSWASASFTAVTASYAVSIPSHTHAASQVTAGTFSAGNYIFSNQVTASTFRLTGVGEGLTFLDGGGLTSSAGYIVNDSRIILIDDAAGSTDGALLFNTRTSVSSSQEELYLDAYRFTHKGQRVITGEWISGSNSRFYGTSSLASTASWAGNSNVSNTTLFASQSRWTVSASWASGSLTSVTSSYSHKAESSNFASQSRWAVSASFASSSVSASYATLARSASYYPTQTYQTNTISASYASSSLSSSFASRISGGSTNYIAKWINNNSLTSSNITDDNTTVTILKNVKHTGSLYRDYILHSIPESTHNNKWLRIAQFNSNETQLDTLGAYLTPARLKIITVPNNNPGASNRGNYAEVSIVNSAFGNLSSIAVTNAYTYGLAMATKIRTSKSASAATWFVDAYIENISSSATLDQMQVILLDGRMTLVNELDPVAGSSVTETSILYPGVHNSSNLEYGFRIEGNDLLVSASANPLRLVGVQSASDSEFLSISSTGVVRKGSTIPTASIAVSASYALTAVSASFSSYIYYNVTQSLTNILSASYASSSLSASYAPQFYQFNTVSASYASSSTTAATASTVTSIASNITHNAENRLLTATGDANINAEGNLTYDGSVFSIYNANLASASLDSGSISVGLRMGAGEGFTIYGNQNFFGNSADAILFQMEDTNAAGGVTDGGFVFRGYSPTLTNPTASNWMTIKSGPTVGIGTMFPVSSLHVVGHISASSFGSGSFHGTASYANRSNVSATTLFASQSFWAVSASWASASLTSSYSHKSENSVFASQSRWATSASFASSSVTSSYSVLALSASYYPAQTYQSNTVSSSWASQSYNADLLDGLDSTYFQQALTTGGTYSITSSWANNSITASVSVTASYTHRAQGSLFASSSLTSSYAHKAESSIFASQSLSSVFASSSITSSYSHKSEASVFASQSRWATSASFASSSVSSSYALLARSASYYPTQTYQLNTISASWASQSYYADTAGYASDADTLDGLDSTYFQPALVTGQTYNITASFTSNIYGGTTNYVAKWEDDTTLTTGNIIDETNLVTVLKSVKHTGSLYRESKTITIPYAMYNDQWIRVGQYNNNAIAQDVQGGYLSPVRLRLTANPANGAGQSNRGNYAEVSIVNTAYGNPASVNVINAYTYGTPMVTRIRTSKSGSAATWFVDAYLTNISASATNDTLQMTLLDGRFSLSSTASTSPITGSTVTETSILYPGVHNSSNLEYGFRIEGNDLLVSASSNPVTLIGVQSASDTEFLTINASGVVRKGSTIPSASVAISASYAPFTQAYQVNTISASFASSSVSSSYAVNALSASYSSFIYYNVTQSLTNIVSASWASSSLSSSWAGRSHISVFASQSVFATSASWASSSISSSYTHRAQNAVFASQSIWANSASWSSRSYYSDTAGDANTLDGYDSTYFQSALTNVSPYDISSSWSNNAKTASYVANAFIQSGNSFGTTATLGTNDAQSLVLRTNGTTRLTINSNGFVGINTSATNNIQVGLVCNPGDLNGATQSLSIITTPTTGSCNNASNNVGLYNLYSLNHPTTFASTQLQTSYAQMTLNVSSSLTGSFRVARNAMLLSSGVKINTSGQLLNTLATTQMSPSTNRLQVDAGATSFASFIGQTAQGVSGSMASFRHFYALAPSLSGTEFTISSATGLYVDSQKISNITTAYGIYQAGTNDSNYFAGNVGIGTTTPGSKLVVIGNIEATSITASLRGTASWAVNATNANNATTADYASDSNNLDGQDASYYLNASNLSTGTLPTGRLSGTYNITSSWATNLVGGIVSSSYALKASSADTAGDADTLDGLDSSYFQAALVNGGTYNITASRAVVANSTPIATSASYANKASTADYATDSNNLDGQDAGYFTNASNISTGTLSSGRLTGTYSITSSWASNAVSANSTPVSVSSSYSQKSSTSDYSSDSNQLDGQSGEYYTDASNLTGTINSSRLSGTYNITASYATVALNVINGNVSASYALKASTADSATTATNADNATNASYASNAGYASDANYLDGYDATYFQPAIATGATLNITAAVALSVPNNSIALGTKTTGDYVQSIYGDSNITVTGGSGEATNPTISLNSTINVTASKAIDAGSVDGYSASSLKNASGINAGTLSSARLSGYYGISVLTASYALNGGGSGGIANPTGGSTGDIYVLKCTDGGAQTYEWIKLVGNNTV